MPHYRDGTKAKLFDTVIMPKWAGAHEEAVVIQINEGQTSCNLAVLRGSHGLVGSMSVHGRPTTAADPGLSSLSAAVIDGNYTTVNAHECELVPRAPDAPAPR